MPDRPSQLSKDMTQAMNLLAHPVAGWAAASAVGMGMAAQAWGLWFGAVAVALDKTRSQPVDAKPAERSETVAAVKARAAAVNLMAEVQSLAREVAPTRKMPATKRTKAAKRDDLKQLPGVGPKLEQMLNGLGVSTYGEIAGWSETDIARVEERLGLPGRIGRDGWVARASELARRGRGVK